MKTTSYKIFYLLFHFTFFSLLLGAVFSIASKVMEFASDDEANYSIATYSVQKLKENPEIIDVKSKDKTINGAQLKYEELELNFKTSDTFRQGLIMREEQDLTI